jgi:hypothetical protein
MGPSKKLQREGARRMERDPKTGRFCKPAKRLSRAQLEALDQQVVRLEPEQAPNVLEIVSYPRVEV